MQDPRYKVMKFTTEELKLPLLMLSRQKLKGNKLMKPHLLSKGPRYVRRCVIENDEEKESVDIAYLRHIAGRHKTSLPVRTGPCPKRVLHLPRNSGPKGSDGLPPNQYDITKEPFESRKGFLVKMRKLPIKYAPRPEPKETFRKEDEEPKPERKRVGRMEFNARAVKPTNRSMVLALSEIVGPPVNKYHPKPYDCHKFRKTSSSAAEQFNTSKAYKFYPKTKVPVTTTFITALTKNQSFTPGPGRYERSYGCFCKNIYNLIMEPDLNDIILKNQSLKALGLPHKRINTKDYFCPFYHNVKGHGHRWLFKDKPQITPLTAEEKTRVKKFETEGAPRAFINRILQPKREVLSFFPQQEKKSMKIVYHALVKLKKRKNLINSRKLAFLSSAPRFKDDVQMTITKKENVVIKPLHNFPVTNIPLDQIKGKLHIDKKLEAAEIDYVSVAKKVFHFKPLPEPKSLVTAEDYLPTTTTTSGYFSKKYRHENFFFVDPIPTEESIQVNDHEA